MRLIVGSLFAVCLLATPVSTTAAQAAKAEVMLFGVFHFANPGLDVVKTDQVNVMTEENQVYLAALAGRIAEFNPTVVLLEFDPARDSVFQERFALYVEGNYELPSNEIYQLGFRVAALSNAATVHGYDEHNIQWQAEPLFDYLEKVDTETGAKMTALFEQISAGEQQAHSELSLQALLARTNDPERDALNRSAYIMTNHVGDGENFVGADATASWWHRNFRMYALVQRHAQPGERVLVIGGQGHIAILRQLLADDPDREAVDIRPYL